MSIAVDFNIHKGDPADKHYSPKDLENLHDSLLGVLNAQNKNNGVLVYSKDAPESNNLVDVMVVFLEKDSTVASNSLDITLPSTFEFFATTERTSEELARGKIVAYDMYNHPVHALLEQNDLNYYSHTGVKIASKENFITPPEKNTLPTIQDDGDVVINTLEVDRESLWQSVSDHYKLTSETILQMSDSDKQNLINEYMQPIVNAIGTGHLSHISITGLGDIYRIYDSGEDCIRYYTSTGYEIDCIEPKLLGIKHDSGNYSLNTDGSFVLNGETFSTPSIDLEKLKLSNGVAELNIGIYYYINADSEFEVYTHTGVKMTSFDISHEQSLLENYAHILNVNDGGVLVVESKEIKHIPDVEITDYHNIDGNFLSEQYRLYENDGETAYADNDGQSVYAILADYNKVKILSKAGVLIDETSVTIPALTDEYTKRITKNGEYYKLPESTVEVFADGVVIDDLPVQPVIPPAIRDVTLDTQLEQDELKSLFLGRSLSSDEADILIAEFTFAADDPRATEDNDDLDLSFANVVTKLVEKNNAFIQSEENLQTLTESSNLIQSELNDKTEELAEKVEELSTANAALTEKDNLLQQKTAELESVNNEFTSKEEALNAKTSAMQTQAEHYATYTTAFEEIEAGLLELQDDLDDVSWFAEPLQKVNALLEKIPASIEELVVEEVVLDEVVETLETGESEIIEETMEEEEMTLSLDSVELFAYVNSDSVMNIDCLPIDVDIINVDSGIYSATAYGPKKSISFSSGRSATHMWEFYDNDGAMIRRVPSGASESYYRFYEIGNKCVKSNGDQVLLTCEHMYKNSNAEYLINDCDYYIFEGRNVRVDMDGDNLFF